MLQGESQAQALEFSMNQVDLFNDLDLAVLGWFIIHEFVFGSTSFLFFSSSTDDYVSYSESLQQEYGTEMFKKDRLKMLKTLLMIPQIYSNPKMHERFELTARRNIQNEIDNLQA